MDVDQLVFRRSIYQLRSPARMPISGFALLIVLGTVILMLQLSAEGPAMVFVDTLIMTTSASCVIGLFWINRQVTLYWSTGDLFFVPDGWGYKLPGSNDVL